MRKTVWFTCAAAICAFTAGAATQTPDPSQKAKGKTVTVTGCVERAAETGTAGTTGTTGTSAMAAKFELTNAEIARGSSSEATGTTGSSKPAAPRLKVESVKMVSATCRE